MADDTDEVAAHLVAIGERLADLAIDRLRRAAEAVQVDGAPDPELVAEEKRITRARRSVDKAVQLLAGARPVAMFEEGP